MNSGFGNTARYQSTQGSCLPSNNSDLRSVSSRPSAESAALGFVRTFRRFGF
jgi:hypothetical protein